MRVLVSLLLMLFIFSLPIIVDAEALESPIRVGIFPFEPINFIDQQGRAQGLYPDLIREIVKDENWSVEFVPGTWAQGLVRLQSGEIDLMTTIAYTPDRAKVMDFNKEAVVNFWGQVFLHPDSKIEKISDLQGLKVAITDRDISGQNFVKTIEGLGVHCIIRRYENHADVFAALQDQKVDAAVAPNHFGLRHAGEYGLVPSSIEFSPFSVYFATKKGRHANLLQHIDQHLAAWKADKGSYYYQRLNFWIGGGGFGEKIIPMWLWASLGLILLVTLISIFISFVFKAQVKKTTSGLRSSERKYRQLVESINNIVLKVDTSGEILFINHYGLEFFGFAEEEILGHNVMETIVPDQDSSGRELKPIIEKILSHPDISEINENENICKDGRRVFIQWRNQPEFDDTGKLLGMFSVGADITERKRVEAELLSKEEKFRTLFEYVADYALILQPRGEELVIVDLNESACQYHGYLREELIGQPISMLDIQKVKSDDPRLKRLWAGETLSFEVTHRRKDGSIFPVEVVIKKIEIDGKTYCFSIERDLTLKKKSEEQRLELETQLRQKYKMEAVGIMAGGIAHDFNNILAIIMTNLELMHRKMEDNNALLPRLEQAKAASLRASSLVKQILTYSRQEKQNLQEVQLAIIVEESLKLLRSTIPASIEILKQVGSDASMAMIDADSTQIEEVLINLCQNAVHAMGEKGLLTVSLTRHSQERGNLPHLSGLTKGDYLRLAVEDTGVGMPPDLTEKIFDPFYTTKPIGQGTGMGLSICNNIVTKHNGLLTVNSMPGQGSTFSAYFPIVLSSQEVNEEKICDDLPTGNERILLIDDEESLAFSVSEILVDHGYSVTTKTSSQEALLLFKKKPNQFDLVITDQTMPGLTGIELASELLKIKPSLPIILCTGYSVNMTEEKAKEVGVKAFFMKPLVLPVLVQATRTVLDS